MESHFRTQKLNFNTVSSSAIKRKDYDQPA